jgi:SNF2 family DNA or RNA helicase
MRGVDEYCYLTQEQAAVYQNVVDTTMTQIENLEGIERKGLVFKLIMDLKQICNHPAHFSSQGHATAEQSGKTARTMDLLKALLENREKALIFTQFKAMGNLLQGLIQDNLKEEAFFFHGGLTRKKRDEMVQTFQTERKNRLMIISLKAGGTSLNLTEASSVIHYDLW